MLLLGCNGHIFYLDLSIICLPKYLIKNFENKKILFLKKYVCLPQSSDLIVRILRQTVLAIPVKLRRPRHHEFESSWRSSPHLEGTCSQVLHPCSQLPEACPSPPRYHDTEAPNDRRRDPVSMTQADSPEHECSVHVSQLKRKSLAITYLQDRVKFTVS